MYTQIHFADIVHALLTNSAIHVQFQMKLEKVQALNETHMTNNWPRLLTFKDTLYFILCPKFFLNRGRVEENKEMRRIGKNVITKNQTKWNKRWNSPFAKVYIQINFLF